MKEIISPEVSMNNEAKRQAVFASMYRYTSEAAHLRQRVLQRVVLGALAGSNEESPLRIGQIRSNLEFGSTGVSFRDETIQESLNQLVTAGDVGSTELKKRHAYFLTEAGSSKVDQWASPSEKLYDEVITFLFNDSSVSLPVELAEPIFKRFTVECFSHFGAQIAKAVTGNLTNGEVGRTIDGKIALQRAILGCTLTEEQTEIVETKCQFFLTSSEPACERLKFSLAQGYYFAQLVGLTPTLFNPLAEQAFSGAVFYLDTNVVLLGVLPHDDSGHFREMVSLAKKLGIELRVTQATIDELTKVLSGRLTAIQKIYKGLPAALLERTNDDILKAFQAARKKDPSITPEAYLGTGEDLAIRIQENLQLSLDPRTSTEIVGERDTREIEATMDREAVAVRGYGKPGFVLEHDAAHFLLIEDLRRENPKTWFLTRDRTLESVATHLRPNENAFSFSLLGFLQCISPFVNTSEEETSLADLLSTFLNNQIRPLDTVFDIGELTLMAEFHSDVMSTPADQLLMAFEFIKSHTLRGLPYREAEIPRVSTELRKFLASDKDTQLKALLSERESVRQNLALSVQETARQKKRGDTLETTVEELRRNLVTTEQSVTSLDQQLKGERSSASYRQFRRERRNAIVFSLLSLLILIFAGQISKVVTGRFPDVQAAEPWIELGVRVVSALGFAVFPWIFFRQHLLGVVRKILFAGCGVLLPCGCLAYLTTLLWATWLITLQWASRSPRLF